MQKLKQGVWSLLILGVAIAAFGYMKNTKPQQPPVEVKQKKWPVEIQTVQLGQHVPVKTLFGQIESSSLVQASAPIAAEVEQVLVKAGQDVKKGSLLVALNQQDLLLPLQSAEADLQDWQAQYDLEKQSYQTNLARLAQEKKVLALKKTAVKRNERLFKKNLASQSVLDQAKEALVRQEYALEGAKLAVEQHKLKLQQMDAKRLKAQNALQQAKLNMQRGRLVAPYDLRVSEVNVADGDRVSPGSPLIVFYSLESLELKAKVPVDTISDVVMSLRDGAPLTGEVVFAGETYSLDLLRLDGAADTRGVDAYFKLPKSLTEARPGYLLPVQLFGKPVEQAFVVPFSAVYGSDRIYVVKDGMLQSKFVQRMGNVNQEGEARVLLKGKLADGDRVVLTHLPNAISGLPVSVIGEK